MPITQDEARDRNYATSNTFYLAVSNANKKNNWHCINWIVYINQQNRKSRWIQQ